MEQRLPTTRRGKTVPKVLFIDWNATLSPSKFWGHLEGTEENDFFLKSVDSLFVFHSNLIDSWMRGGYSTEDILKKVADHTGFKYERLLRELVVSCQKMTFASEKIPKLIRQLRSRGAQIIIATNNMDSFTRWTVPAMKLNIMFDDILNSFDLGALKHDTGVNGKSLFFSNFFERTKMSPKRCIFIDDGEDKKGFIRSLGIDYRRITPYIGLETELKKISSQFTENA